MSEIKWFEAHVENTLVTFFVDQGFQKEQLCGFGKEDLIKCVANAQHIDKILAINIILRKSDVIDTNGTVTLGTTDAKNGYYYVSLYPSLLKEKSMQEVRSILTHELTHVLRFMKDDRYKHRVETALKEANNLKSDSEHFLSHLELFSMLIHLEGEARYYQAKENSKKIGSESYSQQLFRQASHEIDEVLERWENFKLWSRNYKLIAKDDPIRTTLALKKRREKLFDSLVTSAYSIGEYIVITLISAGLQEDQLWNVNEEHLIDTYAIYERNRGKREPLISWDRPSKLQLHRFAVEARLLPTLERWHTIQEKYLRRAA